MVWSWRSGPIDTIVRFDLRAVEGGTHLHFAQTGFTGLRGNLVRLILGTGFRTMYRRKLPPTSQGASSGQRAEDRSRLEAELARLFAPLIRR
jgi:hypothetical protein